MIEYNSSLLITKNGLNLLDSILNFLPEDCSELSLGVYI